jgi:arylsulfatase A-like enzyme
MIRPNILLLHAHDAGRYCQPYGFPVESPHLMRFADQGLLFRKAFCAAPTCAPSRAAMFTGEYPHQCGMFGLTGTQGWEIRDPSRHLVHVMNSEGYQTVLAGVQHETNHADLSPLGYQRILDPRQRQGEFYPGTINRVQEFLSEPHEKPFFLSLGIDEPHRNNVARPEIGVGNDSLRFSKTRYYDPEKLDWRHTAPPPWLPDLPQIRREMASFNEGARIMDEYMGRVLEMLRHRNFEESTLVIITTDHGIEFPGGKKTLTDQGIGVMLMMRGPGGFSGGRVIEPMVSHLDLFPTIMEVIGAERRPWIQGKSLLPLVRGDKSALHAEIFAEQNYHGPLEALRCIRTERHKLVLRHDPVGNRMRHDGASTAVMDGLGHYDRPTGHVELFDLYLDPWEACNRADDPSFSAIRLDLESRLKAWMESHSDCFPSGSFPPFPSGKPW